MTSNSIRTFFNFPCFAKAVAELRAKVDRGVFLLLIAVFMLIAWAQFYRVSVGQAKVFSAHAEVELAKFSDVFIRENPEHVEAVRMWVACKSVMGADGGCTAGPGVLVWAAGARRTIELLSLTMPWPLSDFVSVVDHNSGSLYGAAAILVRRADESNKP